MIKLEHLIVNICKMQESSGNQQFFVRMQRTDDKSHGSILDYECFQTKYLDKTECLKRAWFSASILARFCGLTSMDEIKLLGIEEEEVKILKEAHYLKWK